ncbi:MAG: hypothetical protein MR912_08630 [Prevotella sp.]|nr:hypothetical protein [Prevotella sp.]
MNNKVFGAIIFTAGAVIGSLVTWKVVKTKYEDIAQEEIDSVKEEYTRLMVSMRKKLNDSVTYKDDEDDESEENRDDDDFDDSTITNYNEIVKSYRSSDEEENNQNEKEGEEKEEDNDGVSYMEAPYVISPDDFGSIPGYNVEPLDYFADGILADGWGVELDIAETIGEDAVNHFGDYDDDVVYVRNEQTNLEYEVTRDPRTYAEAVRTNPNPYYGNEN